ncbi:MAG: NHL repeat-containing protein [Candidatus Cloacimonetes bacterium]|nr:NHL repeat-containing protein [Candidatus Cloacimonadota bacterium]
MKLLLVFILILSNVNAMKAKVSDTILNLQWDNNVQGTLILKYYKGKFQFKEQSSTHYLYQTNSIAISLKETNYNFVYDNCKIEFNHLKYKVHKTYKTYGLGRGKLQTPISISSDEFDHLFLVDISSDSIFKYSRNFQFIKKFGSFNWDTNDSYDADFSSIDEGSFDHPTSITYGPRLGYIVTDSRNNRLVELDMDGNFKNEIATRQRLDEPNKVIVNQFKEILVLDSQNDRLLILNSFGQFLYSIGGFGSDSQKLNNPSDFTIDSESNIYILDHGNNALKKYSRIGKFITSIKVSDKANSIYCDPSDYLYLFLENTPVVTYSKDLISFFNLFDTDEHTKNIISTTSTSNHHLYMLNEKSSLITEWVPRFFSQTKQVSIK